MFADQTLYVCSVNMYILSLFLHRFCSVDCLMPCLLHVFCLGKDVRDKRWASVYGSALPSVHCPWGLCGHKLTWAEHGSAHSFQFTSRDIQHNSLDFSQGKKAITRKNFCILRETEMADLIYRWHYCIASKPEINSLTLCILLPYFLYTENPLGSKVKTQGMSANALARQNNLHNVRW